jgi:predicted RNase H-like nuclease (RuvC/YqgF family)
MAFNYEHWWRWITTKPRKPRLRAQVESLTRQVNVLTARLERLEAYEEDHARNMRRLLAQENDLHRLRRRVDDLERKTKQWSTNG